MGGQSYAGGVGPGFLGAAPPLLQSLGLAQQIEGGCRVDARAMAPLADHGSRGYSKYAFPGCFDAGPTVVLEEDRLVRDRCV